MIRITNGKNIIQVTTGAYNNTFKNKGYTIVKDDDIMETGQTVDKSIRTDTKVEEEIEEKEKDLSDEDEEDFEEEHEDVVEEETQALTDKPISEWSKKELTTFVKENGIKVNLQGVAKADKAGVIRNAVAEYLENNE